MQLEGFIELEESKPGIFMIKQIAKDHVGLRGITCPKFNSTDVSDKSKFPDGYWGPPKIEDVRIIKGQALNLYAQFGYKSGDCVSQSEARQVVDNFVRSKNLQCKHDPSLILLDKDVLMKLCDPKLFIESPESTLAKPCFVIGFRDLISCALKHLQVAYRLTYPGPAGPFCQIWTKKEVPQIYLYPLAKVGKKLTRIVNVELFNIDPNLFVKQLKLCLACTVGRVEDPKYPTSVVIQAQGSHLSTISNILTDSYSIPKRYIIGYTEPEKKKK